MPGPLYHVGAVGICPHAGMINTISANVRVLVSGMPVATIADQSLIAGCAFNIAGVPLPCLRVQWLVPAVRVLINGQPALLQTSPGLCMGLGPPGPAAITTNQPRVIGT
jgi:hypothetical protein